MRAGAIEARMPRAVTALLTVVLATAALAACSSPVDPAEGASPGSTGSGPATACPAGTPTTPVTTADDLATALAEAAPGDVIALADGRYEGRFTLAASGTQSSPITLCGSSAAVLDGGPVDSGYTLHLDGVAQVVLAGFSVTGGQKGVMLDASSNNHLSGLAVSATGDEAVHLRASSSDNLVENTTVTGTGLREPRFGEGFYIGTAESNWCDISACEPDRSDRNRLIDNTVTGTTAEAVDIKEGTSGGLLQGNTLDGSAVTEVDSLIDVKGSDWTILDTIGTAAPLSGAQVHVIVDGWGARNTFRGNTFDVPADGYAIEFVGAARSAANTASCDNTALVDGIPTALALSPLPCTP